MQNLRSPDAMRHAPVPNAALRRTGATRQGYFCALLTPPGSLLEWKLNTRSGALRVAEDEDAAGAFQLADPRIG